VTGPEPDAVTMAHQIMSGPSWLFASLTDVQDREATLRSLFVSETVDVEGSAINFLKLLDQDSGSRPIIRAKALSLASDTGSTLLHLSASLDFSKLLSDLIARKADLDLQDNNGNTPLHLAALYGQRACAQILIENGANTRIADFRGLTPRKVALDFCHTAIADMLDAPDILNLARPAISVLDSTADCSPHSLPEDLATGPLLDTAIGANQGIHGKIIRLSEIPSATAIEEPLQGQPHWVTSVTFSPDGTCIISGLGDNTILLWDTASRTAIGGPRGHSRWVTPVAFLPDGTPIASGPDDSTLRLWDTASGTAIGEPLRGQVCPVASVAFSRDGACIVSP